MKFHEMSCVPHKSSVFTKVGDLDGFIIKIQSGLLLLERRPESELGGMGVFGPRVPLCKGQESDERLSGGGGRPPPGLLPDRSETCEVGIAPTQVGVSGGYSYLPPTWVVSIPT